MKGWILHRPWDPHEFESHSIVRFREVAKEHDIELAVYTPEQFDLSVTKEDRSSILLDGKPVGLPDFVLPRMGARTTYFSFAVIRHLERLGVPCFNNSVATDTVKDKLYTQQILAENNLPVPKTMLVKFPVNVELVEKHIGFPVVVKTLYGAQGKGVFLAEDRTKFLDMMQLIEVTNDQANIILQEFIADSRGRDLRVFTIGGKVVACMQRTSAGEDNFKANYSQGGTVKAFPITEEIEWLATEISKLMELDIAGVDLLFDGDGYKVCEVNSSPGFKGIESCVDISIPNEIFHYIRVRLGIF